MRKLMSLLLAVVMVMSLATVAFAADWDGTYAASESTTFEITKTYTSDETFVPGEVLSFTILNTVKPEGVTTAPELKIGENNTYTVTDLTNTITVTVPAYTAAGVYEYTINEVEGNTAGVTTYDKDTTINVIVLVEYDNVNHKLVLGNDIVDGVQIFIKKINGEKVSEITNVFQTNDFTVAKNVEGNMANETDKFEVTVTLTSAKPVLTAIEVGGTAVAATEWENKDGTYTYTKVLTISEEDGATAFNNIPYGVAVTVEENTDATKMNGYTAAGYTVNGTKADSVSFSIDDENPTTDVIIVENTKEAEVSTGIITDSAPYIILIAVCALAAVLFVTKRRSVEF